MRIDLLARRWGGPDGGRDGMSIAVSFLAWTLAELGHQVRCYHAEGTVHPWQHPLVEWRPREPLFAPDDWTADLVISTIHPAWVRTTRSAAESRAIGRLVFWHHHGALPPGYGAALAKCAELGEVERGWARSFILPPSTWAAEAGGEQTGQCIVVPGASRAKGGVTALAVARKVTDVPWFVLPGRATEQELAPWLALPHATIAAPRLLPTTWLAEACLVLSPTRAETYGLAMVEAASRGIPVVTSDLPGPRSALGDVATYLPMDAPVAAWVSAVRGALDRPAARRRSPSYAEVVRSALALRDPAPVTASVPTPVPAPVLTALKGKAGRPATRAVAPAPAGQLPPLADPSPLVTISMSYCRTPDQVARAVKSILAQTERRLRLVVVNDGDDPSPAWAPLAHVTDARLVRVDLPANRGTYHAHAVTLAACDTEWWLPHDSDDWSDPGRLAALLAAGAGADFVAGTTELHDGEVTREEPAPREGREARPSGIDHPAHWSGLWRASWLRSVGGPCPSFRLGYDSVLVSLAYACGRVRSAPGAVYHREMRDASLWHAEATRRGSPARTEAWARVLALLAEARAPLASGGGPDQVGKLLARSIPSEMLDEVQRSAAGLRPRLAPPRRHGISVAVPTHERPALCLDLLRDLAGQTLADDLTVTVYQDGGAADYSAVQAFLAERGWRFVRRARPQGKAGYWRAVNRIWADWREAPARFLVQLADDFRLTPRSIERLLEEWEGISDPRKCMLNPLRDASRAGKPCWTKLAARRLGRVDAVGWNDCTYLTTPAALGALGWELQPIPETRWAADPLLSSGVGEQISRRAIEARLGLYQTGRSAVDHVGIDSRMNPRERAAHPLRALGFGPVVASLASIPARVEALRKVVASLLPQVDRLRVYLNNYTEVPAFLSDPRVEVERSQDHGDLGDAGKFFWAEQDAKLGGWVLTCDDDLVYPPDYVRTMVDAAERHGRRAAVSAHGATLVSPVVSYYKSRTQYHCLQAVPADVPAHVLGTGVLCYHSGTLRLARTDFQAPNMADIWFALAAQRQRVPCVVVAHAAGWLRDIPETRAACIYRSSARGSGGPADTGALQTATIRAWSPWRLLSSSGATLAEVG